MSQDLLKSFTQNRNYGSMVTQICNLEQELQVGIHLNLSFRTGAIGQGSGKPFIQNWNFGSMATHHFLFRPGAICQWSPESNNSIVTQTQTHPQSNCVQLFIKMKQTFVAVDAV